MRLNEFQTVDPNKLDDYLAKLCAMIKKGQADRPEYYGKVAAGILTPKGKFVAKLNYPNGHNRVHAERAVIEEYTQYHGSIPEGSVMITTLSPCNEDDDKTADTRHGMSCTDLINHHGFEHVYCGYKDPTQDHDHGDYQEVITKNTQLKEMCKKIAWTFLKNLDENFISETAMMGKIADSGKIIRILKKAHTVSFSDEKNWLLVDVDPAKGNKGLGIKWIPADTRFEWVRPYRDTVDENFADGRHPEDKGDSARHGIPKHASLSKLDSIGHGSGRKAQLARWQANMRSGRNK
jgi:pyrimidine deaminase RibD-like protein